MRKHKKSGIQAKKGSISGCTTVEFSALIRKRLGDPPDLIARHLIMRGSPVVLLFLNGLADAKLLSETVLETIVRESALPPGPPPATQTPFAAVYSRSSLDESVEDLLGGKSLLFREGDEECLVLDTFGPRTRNVEEPAAETVTRGPREAFVENIGDNVALVRLGLKNPALRVRELHIGEHTKTAVYVLYVDGLAIPSIVEEVLKQLGNGQVKRVAGHGTVARQLQTSPYSLFPTTLVTERPDRVVAGLLEGRIAVLVDRTPFSVLVPSVFVEHLQSPEDYYENRVLQSTIRIIRYAMFHLAVLGPALYVAAITFHQEMIPTSLLVTLLNTREVVPFPAALEAFIMGFVFEGLREAGVRLPRPIGQAVSIVGGIVLGQAAITAGIVSPAMVIVVGITAIASFTVPSLSLNAPQLILRPFFLLGAAVLGLYGIILLFLFVLGHLLSVRSFGVPYLFPLAPTFKDGLVDTLVVGRPEVQDLDPIEQGGN